MHPLLLCFADVSDVGRGAVCFYVMLVVVFIDWVVMVCCLMGCDMVVLFGGCLYNCLLLVVLYVSLLVVGCEVFGV